MGTQDKKPNTARKVLNFTKNGTCALLRTSPQPTFPVELGVRAVYTQKIPRFTSPTSLTHVLPAMQTPLVHTTTHQLLPLRGAATPLRTNDDGGALLPLSLPAACRCYYGNSLPRLALGMPGHSHWAEAPNYSTRSWGPARDQKKEGFQHHLLTSCW